MRCSANGVSVFGPLEEDAAVDAWPKIEGYLSDALERDGWKLGPADLLQQVAEGLTGLYVIEDDETGEILGAVAAEVQEYQRVTVFNIAFCGGRDLYRWAGLLAAMEQEAVRLGCPIVRITGRPGWGRVFPDYSEVHRVFERKVMVAK